MRLNSLLIACIILLSAVSIFAQSGGAAVDPISGTWTGDIGPNSTTRHPVMIELKFDGKAAFSGSITGPPHPGEIKGGTFDPQTGALKLEVDIKGDGNVFHVVFEGTVVSGVATGRVSGTNLTGNFKITKVGGTSSPEKQPGGINPAAALRMSFTEVNGWVTKAADLVPAEKYSYRPAPTVRTFGQLVAHIADSYNYFCARAAGQNVQWSEAVEKGSADKATIVQKLKQASDACNVSYDGTNQAGPLFVNIGHTNLHYGNIITYMRMLGLTPPSN